MRIRITFSKQGPLRYTGHLDLHKLWERAARRAELPLAYSQGFHPQPKMNMAAALPLGFSSRCEVMDMKLEHDMKVEGLREKLQQTLPAGIQVLSVDGADEHAPTLQTQVASAEYQVTLMASIGESELKHRIDSVMESESIIRERRGKTYDLRPLIEELALTPAPSLRSAHLHCAQAHVSQSPDGRGEKIVMRLAAREGATGRPEEVLDTLGIAFEETGIERTNLIFRS
jgi:radical SAM-linked protein